MAKRNKAAPAFASGLPVPLYAVRRILEYVKCEERENAATGISTRETVNGIRDQLVRSLLYGGLQERDRLRVKILTDREVLLAAVKLDPTMVAFAAPILNPKLEKDREIVLTVVAHGWWSLNYVDATLWGDREIVLAAVKHRGLDLAIAPELSSTLPVTIAQHARLPTVLYSPFGVD